MKLSELEVRCREIRDEFGDVEIFIRPDPVFTEVLELNRVDFFPHLDRAIASPGG